MFFRFGSGVFLAVLISLAGIALEKRNLELRREVSRQHYQTDVLVEAHAKLRLKTQELGAPVRLIDSLESGHWDLLEPQKTSGTEQRTFPLLRWQRATPLDF